MMMKFLKRQKKENKRKYKSKGLSSLQEKLRNFGDLKKKKKMSSKMMKFL
jgi:hypothetical protein